jgi:hypothetical protein
VAVYANLFTNPQPSPAGVSAGWGQAPGTGGTAAGSTISGAAGPASDYARRVTWSVSATSIGGNVFAGSPSALIPVTAGNTYSGALWVRSSVAKPLNARMTFYTTNYGAVVSAIDGPNVNVAANTWTLLVSLPQTAPATSENVRILVGISSGQGATAPVAGDTIDVQAATVVLGSTLPQPFHGGMTSDVNHTYAWTGTADASTSLLAMGTVLGVTAIGTGGAPAGPVTVPRLTVGATATATATAPAGAATGTALVVGVTATATASTPAAPNWIRTDPWNPADPWPGPHAIIGVTATAAGSVTPGTPRVVIVGATATATAAAPGGTPGITAVLVGVTAGATATAPSGTPRAAAVLGGATATATALAAAGNAAAGRIIAGATATATATATPGAFFSVAAIHTIGLATLTSSGLSVATLTGDGLSVAVLHTTD